MPTKGLLGIAEPIASHKQENGSDGRADKGVLHNGLLDR